jgi:probable HAF family extracellular repeat protein
VGQADWRYGENNDSYNERAVVYDITNELLYPIPLISDPSDSVDDNLDPCHNDSRESSARHISNSGFVTGYSQIDGEIHAYRYRLPSYQAEGAVEQVTDLHPEELSTGQTGDDVFDIDGWSYGNAVNDQGVVVGMATTHDNTFQAYIYTDSGKMRTIHPSSDSLDEEERYSEALDINNNNQVVGVYKTQDDPEKLTAFIYEHETGSFADLNKRIDCSAGVYVGQAKKILDDGRILVDVQVLPDVVDENNRPVNRPAILTPSEGSASPCLDESEEDDSDSSGGGPIGSWLLLLGSMLCLRRFCVKS